MIFLNSNGTINTSIGSSGFFSTTTNVKDGATAVQVDTVNGKIYLVGMYDTTLASLYRLNLSAILLSTQSYQESKISLSPNPTNSILNIQTNETIRSVSVTDILGRTTKINNFSNNKIDVSNLSNGVYIIEVATENRVFKNKFIKE